MAYKSIKFTSKNDRIERVENAMLGLGQAVNNNLLRLGKDIKNANGGIELIYEEMMARTLRGRWKRFKKWIGGKK